MAVPMIKTPGEYTDVGMETEVKIPWETWKRLLILGPFSIWCFWALGSVVWMGAVLVKGQVSLWRWASRSWSPWMGRWWWLPLALCLVWWGSAPTWATIYRFLIETVVKQTPQYTPYPSELGRWRPFRQARRYDEEEFDQEAETPPYKVEGRIQKGKNQVLYLEFELEGYDAALKWHKFCKAVAHKKRNFSYNEAVKRHKLSPADWGRIYNTFILQECVKPTGQRGTPELLDTGRDWVRLYADTPPPSPA